MEHFVFVFIFIARWLWLNALIRWVLCGSESSILRLPGADALPDYRM